MSDIYYNPENGALYRLVERRGALVGSFEDIEDGTIVRRLFAGLVQPSTPQAYTVYNAVRVTWADPRDGYKNKTELVHLGEPSVSVRWSEPELPLIAHGATSVGQARRIGLWWLRTQGKAEYHFELPDEPYRFFNGPGSIRRALKDLGTFALMVLVLAIWVLFIWAVMP